MTKRIFQSRPLMIGLAVVLLGGGLLAVVQGLVSLRRGMATPTPTVLPSPTRHERLIPTPTASDQALSRTSPTTPPPTATPTPSATSLPPTSTPTSTPPPSSTPTRKPTASPSPTATTPPPTPTPTQTVGPGLYPPRRRIGVVDPRGLADRVDMARLGPGWYHPCNSKADLERSAGIVCAYSARISGATFAPNAAQLADMARRDPGKLWLVGNEPDVIWQANSTPQQYAKAYHDVYEILKAADPTCQVAIGGISQVTPLRLRYLDALLAAYQEAYGQPMPVEVWNIHLAILREERGSWGVDIPPGIPGDTGVLYEIQDNGKIEILKEQVWTFRRWMNDRGLRNKPLIVTEFSVLMPPDYGFPFETVRAFMLDSFDFLLTARDSQIGYPTDGNRLVQLFTWYSIADMDYFTGNMFDPESGQITRLGQVFADYVAGLAP